MTGRIATDVYRQRRSDDERWSALATEVETHASSVTRHAIFVASIDSDGKVFRHFEHHFRTEAGGVRSVSEINITGDDSYFHQVTGNASNTCRSAVAVFISDSFLPFSAAKAGLAITIGDGAKQSLCI